MIRLGTLMRTMTVVVTLFVLVVCVNAEEMTETYNLEVPVSPRDAPEVKQSRVTITINGKELLNNLETELKMLEKADVNLRRELDRLVVTSDIMGEELTGLLETARAVMREHTGRIEIVHEDADDHLVKTLSTIQVRQGADPNEMHTFALSLPRVGAGVGGFGGGGFGGMGGFGGGGGAFIFDPFISDRYAYAEEDRKQAAELEHQSRDLARQYTRPGDETKRNELATKLKANLNELFDLKLKGYKEKMTGIELELDRLRTKVQEREKNREFIVTGRFKELVGEDNHLRW